MWNVISKTHVYFVTPRGLGLNTGVRLAASHRQGLCTEYNIRGPTVCASDLRITSPNPSPSIMLYATTVVWDFESFLYIEA